MTRLSAASGTLRVVAISLYKIANDLRLMASGPRAGLAEISLPDLQPGSSIMPGKVNPVVCEAVCQVAAQVIGNDATVAFCGTAGNFELNVMMPVLARNLLESVRLLASVAPLLADRCVAGIQAHPERLRRYAESSASIVTALNRFIGYEAGAKVAKQALADRQYHPRGRDRAGARRERRDQPGATRRGARRTYHDPNTAGPGGIASRSAHHRRAPSRPTGVQLTQPERG